MYVASLITPSRTLIHAYQVNRMCSSLTDQVRSIAKVTTAVAKGDLTQKIDIEVEGEMLTLKETVNKMVDQLSGFASEVTRVAQEVGTQGILGGQAVVQGAEGTWDHLTRNVNVRACRLEPLFISADHDATHHSENGAQLDGSSAVHLRSHEGRRARRLEQDGPGRCPGRDVRAQDDREPDGVPSLNSRAGGHSCLVGGRNGGYHGRPSARS